MAGSVNKVILVGNLGADPEIKSFQNGGRIANLRLATSESWNDRASGERRERTEWHSIVVNSDGLVRVVEQYLRKGSKIYVEGQLQTRKWQDRDGNDRYSTEVVVGMRGQLTMLDGRRDGEGGGNWDRGSGGSRSSPPASGGFGGDRGGGFGGGAAPSGGFDDMDDDVPF